MNYKHNFFLERNSDAMTDFAFVQTMRETILRKIERQKRGRDGWIDHTFSDKRGAEIYETLVPLLENDWFFNDFCAAVINEMCAYKFWEHPSVNLVNESEINSINLKKGDNRIEYRALAQINLMEHTKNVIESCQIYFDEKHRKSVNFKKLIAVAALFHDIGKHYPMMRDEGIIDDNLARHEYKHHHFSSLYFNQKALKVMGVDCKAMTFELDQISSMIFEHHDLKFEGEPKGFGSLDLIEIDRMARSREMQEMNIKKHELASGIYLRKMQD